MAVNYTEEKNYKKADEYFQKADNMRIGYCNIEGYGAAYKEIVKKLVIYISIDQLQIMLDYSDTQMVLQ
jgi:hypothetical protein